MSYKPSAKMGVLRLVLWWLMLPCAAFGQARKSTPDEIADDIARVKSGDFFPAAVEQIGLAASVSSPTCTRLDSQTWTPPTAGAPIGNFVASTASGTVTPISQVPANAASYTYYFTVPASSASAQYAYVLQGTSGDVENGPTATATFGVSGPTGASASISGQAWGISPDQSEVAWGIKFNAVATPPTGVAGQFLWVQLIPSYSSTDYLNDGGTLVCSAGPGIDTAFPYPNGNGLYAEDGPSSPLDSTLEHESKVSVSFQTYLLWNPTVGTAPIPIPLGSATWGISGDIKWNAASSSWTQVTGGVTNSAFAPSAAFPPWSATLTPASIAASCN